MKTQRLILWALSFLICTAANAQALPDDSASAVWRATSRLGYGPTPALAQAAAPSAKAWSLAQIDTAYAASQQSAKVPTALRAITRTRPRRSKR